MTDADDPIIVSLATVPRRLRNLEKVVSRLLPQCDRMNVYLNGHRSVPSFLRRPKIEVAVSSEHGDLGDAGKFWWSEEIGPAYHMTVDDDILYPPDYCKALVAKIQQLDRRAVIGVHGVMLPSLVKSAYYGDRRVYPCFNGLKRSRAVHLLGTGTLAYHTETVTVRRADFLRPNMADVWFCLLARRQGVPMICMRRARGWLSDMGDPNPKLTIAATQSKHDAVQARALRSMNPWPPPATLMGIERGTMRKARRHGARGLLKRAQPHAANEFGARRAESLHDRDGRPLNSGVRIKR